MSTPVAHSEEVPAMFRAVMWCTAALIVAACAGFWVGGIAWMIWSSMHGGTP